MLLEKKKKQVFMTIIQDDEVLFFTTITEGVRTTAMITEGQDTDGAHFLRMKLVFIAKCWGRMEDY